MEPDTDAANIGPEASTMAPVEAQSAPKMPRRRIVGRRTVAEKTATRAAQDDEETTKTSEALIASQPTRPVRALHNIPDTILNDPDINAAIAILPYNYNFEIHKTIHRIRSSRAQHVALQLPEGLLMFAPLISDVLTQFCPGISTTIMGDVTYGACCIDDFTARALGCDLLIHYGHSCLVPIDTTGKDGLKVMYVFVTIGIDVEHFIASIEQNFPSGKRVALVGTIQFNNTLHAIVPRLRQLGYDPVLPRSSPLSAGEILGCTAPTICNRSKDQKQQDKDIADMILYLGDGRFHLEAILIASPQLRAHTYRYDPYSRRLTHETYDHEEMHSLRRAAIQAARETLRSPSKHTSSTSLKQVGESKAPHPSRPKPRTWGLILGTLGRQGNPYTLDLITHHLNARGIPYITLLLSEVMPAKLALMSGDVAVWVQVACPRLSIDWGYAFERPLLSPYEACVALGVKEGTSWLREHIRADGTDHETTELEEVDWAMRTAELEDTRSAGGKTTQASNQSAPTADLNEMMTPVYPMDYYEKTGLGRVRAQDVLAD